MTVGTCYVSRLEMVSAMDGKEIEQKTHRVLPPEGLELVDGCKPDRSFVVSGVDNDETGADTHVATQGTSL